MASHAHSGHMPSSGKALVISAWLTGVYFVIELAVGLWTGSIAVLSDAFHTLVACSWPSSRNALRADLRIWRAVLAGTAPRSSGRL